MDTSEALVILRPRVAQGVPASEGELLWPPLGPESGARNVIAMRTRHEIAR